MATNDLPRIEGKWRYYDGKDRVQMLLPPERFSEVQIFLTQAFGPPMESNGRGAVYAGGAVIAYLSCNYFEESTCVEIPVQK